MKRTHYNTALSEQNIGEKVCVSGWVQKIRNLGSIIFVDLRDRTGIIQLSFGDGTDREVFAAAEKLRGEYVIEAEGIVRSRGAAVNKDKKTGTIEIEITALNICGEAVTPPFEIDDSVNVNEELRLKYRYLELRRPALNSNIIFRHNVQRMTRDYFYDNGFIDIETPNLIKPTPEGARDFLVPSRIHHGKFYVLPQSPQIYKQLLMVAGFDRYFQIARCFRDEDLRSDRQLEFTQIDLEMSFVDENDIMDMIEGYLKKLFGDMLGYEIKLPIRRMRYDEAMDRYGSDKPDLRFGYELLDLTEISRTCSFKVFAETAASGEFVKGIKIDGEADSFTRKEIDSLTEYIKGYKAKGLAWYKIGDTVSSSYAKFLTEEENAAIIEKMGAKKGDILFIVADKAEIVADSLGALRCEIARRLGKIEKGVFSPLWITDFPMFEYGEEEGRWFAKHHPFTQPKPEDMQYLETDPGRIRARAYDIVINGSEVGGGSIRINNPALQEKILNFLGYDKETANERFGFLLESYKYGAPQHGGLAFGFDRLVTIMLGLTSIRDVIAFPKVQNASELMSGAPAPTDAKSIRELGIGIIDEK